MILPDGTDTGGGLDRTTVYASLGYNQARVDDRAGTEAIPIYVIWKNTNGNNILPTQWWWTKVLVGADGSVAQPQYPNVVSPIPGSAAAHAVITGVFGDDGSGLEDIVVDWSERTLGGNPSPGPTCPTSAQIDVKWHDTLSQDNGSTWGCGSGWPCDGANALIDEDTQWFACVGKSRIGTSAFMVNDDRPEVVMNRVSGTPRIASISSSRSTRTSPPTDNASSSGATTGSPVARRPRSPRRTCIRMGSASATVGRPP
ncbi:MAG TPA: hypothetical protein VHB21_10990 [Minicystis sp.]|nr:hypothetical protein [Minicystis sp.]